MSVEPNREPAQSTDTERREAPGDRVPFEGIVEVGGALGPSFEAQAVDVSETGMHLRTAYLPELGQPLTCRIEIDHDVVLAAGEVVWRQEADRGGDFGLRFTELDPASEAALKKLVSVEPDFPTQTAGTRVRLHIEGLGSPMRARVKGSAAEGLVVGSELGFLQVGKELELEDARTGGKRAARIHRVGVEVNPETHIPQLVVSLRYDVTDADGLPAQASSHPPPLPASHRAGAADSPEDTPEPIVIDDENPRATMPGIGLAAREVARAAKAQKEDADDDALGPMRSGMGEVLHRASAKMGPTLGRLAAQARTTFGLVAARAKKVAAKADVPATRRTTAPPPTGALHASGRKVVRSDRPSAMDVVEGKAAAPFAKRRMVVGSAVLVAGVVVLAAVHKPAPKAVATTDSNASAAAAPGASVPAAVPTPLPGQSSPQSATPAPSAPEEAPVTPTPLATDDSRGHKGGKPLHVTPFVSGAVGPHANVLHLKMDGMIEKIEGATTPTGFNLVIPDRRSLEAASPLASRDSRIASIRVTNEAHGAELAISFKDGVPNYQVRAKGDSLEIFLAPQGNKAQDTDDVKPTKHTKHLLRH